MRLSSIFWMIGMILRGKGYDVLDSVLNKHYYRVDFENVDRDALGVAGTGGHDYVNSSPSLLRKAMRTCPVTDRDVVLDVGCGKGGAMATLARMPFGQVHGVELSGDLCRICRDNLARMRLTHCTVFNQNALDLDLSPYTYVYMYNPFACDVVAAFLERLGASLAAAPRPLTLVYNNPQCAQAVEDSGLFGPGRVVGDSRTEEHCAISVAKGQ